MDIGLRVYIVSPYLEQMYVQSQKHNFTRVLGLEFGFTEEFRIPVSVLRMIRVTVSSALVSYFAYSNLTVLWVSTRV